MEIKERLEKELRTLSNKLTDKNISLSIKKSLLNDYDFLADVYIILGYGKPIDMVKELSKKYNLKSNIFEDIVWNDLEELDKIATEVIGMFKSINFYTYYNKGYVGISAKDKADILREFFEYFNKEFSELYNMLKKDNRIIETNVEAAGMSFMAPSIDSYYLLLDKYTISGINDLCTIAHELAHIYVYRVLKNYKKSALRNIYESYLSECISLYIEYSLCEWMIRKNIYSDNVKKYLNFADYSQLYWFKCIKYFCILSDRSDVILHTDLVDYQFSGNIEYNEDHDLAFFRYPSTMSEGEYINFKYAISSLDVYELLRKEKEGYNIKKMIIEYITKFQYEELLLIDQFLDYDYTFMKDNIRKRTNELLRKYPIPEYRIQGK